MTKYTLKFEKINQEDFLELPVIYTTNKKDGKSGEKIWEDYVKAYNHTRKRIDYYLENLFKIKNQLERDFNEFEWISKEDNKG